MLTNRQPDGRVHRIQPARLIAFAEFAGWMRVSNKRTDVAVLKGPRAAPAYSQLIIPLNPDADDFGDRINDSVLRLSEVESRPAAEIVDELVNPPADILRFRIADRITVDGSVPLHEGVELIKAAERSLRASGCSAIEEKQVHPRLSRTETDDLIRNSRLSAERGSFVAVVIVPLDAVPLADDAANLFNLAPVPFVRRATTHLMRSVYDVRRHLADGTPDRIADSVEGLTVSANLCDALLAMEPLSPGGTLEISCSWARTLPRDPALPTTIELRQEWFLDLERAAAMLRPAALNAEATFIGKIAALMGRPDADGNMAGDVVLQFQDDGDLARAKLDLAHGDYELACDAHKRSRFVSVTGTLFRRSRVHQIAHYKEFRAL